MGQYGVNAWEGGRGPMHLYVAQYRVILKIMSKFSFAKGRIVKMDRIAQFLYFL